MDYERNLYEGAYVSSQVRFKLHKLYVTYKFKVSMMFRSSDSIDVWVKIWGHY